MRSLAALACCLLFTSPAMAQREALVGLVLVTAEDTSCWSSPTVPCEDIGRAEVKIRAGDPARVRIVSVDVMAADGDGWQHAAGLLALRQMDMRTGARPPRPDGVVRFRAGERDKLVILFEPIRAHEGRVRVTLDVNGRRVTVEAAHTVTHLQPF